MKYAAEIIQLLSENPERKFRTHEILRSMNFPGVRHETLRYGVHRVLTALVENGSVVRERGLLLNRSYVFQWCNNVQQ
ncbi:hypothetical protein KMC49_gp08 [Ralstonia phage Firinga]|uniref:Uncharacterized protein n=3 Tax=Firingavirus TaxID=2843381 RepID=A0A7G5B9V3_9CAUD|nr:hypothetical protein X532_gp52 [Ralstonia phage RSK1]YP_010078547.1 hypothetical protein KMC49_gp08 [Ralstonia phage Firinga]QMV33076.1 hypothetical protein 18C_00008 [Ralstonia phage Firinga]QMV33330.1 hypothetical protein 12C_00020 [Ralstonia phage Hennie]BAO04717.1 putative phage protein [Ralstonia phage RSK1]